MIWACGPPATAWSSYYNTIAISLNISGSPCISLLLESTCSLFIIASTHLIISSMHSRMLWLESNRVRSLLKITAMPLITARIIIQMVYNLTCDIRYPSTPHSLPNYHPILIIFFELSILSIIVHILLCFWNSNIAILINIVRIVSRILVFIHFITASIIL